MTSQAATTRVDAHMLNLAEAGFTVGELTAADIDDYVALVGSAYRGEASRQGWTTEADLLGGQRLDATMAREMLDEPDSTIILLRRAVSATGVAHEAVGSVYLRRPCGSAEDPGGSAGNDDAGAGIDGGANTDDAGAGTDGGANTDDGTAYLGVLAVAPQGQGRGVGSALLDLAEAWVAERWTARRLRMTVIDRREDLIAYYVRRGYEPTGNREPFPYGDERFGIPQVEGLEFVELVKTLH
ncbi:acetyltransferase (GNAT) family protein [Brevibacterium sanguinis]|uniref:Acetyltransferase (GNAT) family protein n=2 Tax=Brevibacterium TaxID=1696 RepID=A0A366IM63_9MICO|nr:MULTISPECIES: GNAT family N-acetyltransferase [Brevibacterium]RBP65492.1 acetyltransferase (GNAT) family protein [Brevibacterium sanguinis]RBP72126.1 acetyltransferase (GNAT) family protein [Brevibacterium celere]